MDRAYSWSSPRRWPPRLPRSGRRQPSIREWFARGKLNFKRHSLPKAVDDCTRAIELKPDYIDAWLGRAELQMARRKFKDALEDVDRALEIDGHNAWAYVRRGEALMGLNRWAEAKQEFQMALQLNAPAGARIRAEGLIHVIEQ